MTVSTLKTAVLDRLTEEEFAQLCLDHRDLRIGRDSSGQLTSSPASSPKAASPTTSCPASLATETTIPAGAGWATPRPATRCPTAQCCRPVSWVALDRWQALPATDRRRFARICPDFVMELASSSDRLPALLTKMHDWLGAGVRLAWLDR